MVGTRTESLWTIWNPNTFGIRAPTVFSTLIFHKFRFKLKCVFLRVNYRQDLNYRHPNNMKCTFKTLLKESNYYLNSTEPTSSVIPAREVMTPARKQIFLIWFFFTQRRTITMFNHQPARKKIVVKIVTLLLKSI